MTTFLIVLISGSAPFSCKTVCAYPPNPRAQNTEPKIRVAFSGMLCITMPILLKEGQAAAPHSGKKNKSESGGVISSCSETVLVQER